MTEVLRTRRRAHLYPGIRIQAIPSSIFCTHRPKPATRSAMTDPLILACKPTSKSRFTFTMRTPEIRLLAVRDFCRISPPGCGSLTVLHFRQGCCRASWPDERAALAAELARIINPGRTASFAPG